MDDRRALFLLDPAFAIAGTAAARTLGGNPSRYLMNTPVTAILERKGSTVYSVSPQMTIAEAVAEMNRHRVGSVLVLDDGKLVGIFTERDVLRRVVGANVDANRGRVAEVMSTGVITITRDVAVEETMQLFTERRCRHLPVVENGQLLGTISIGDITRYMADQHRTEAEHLKAYIAGGLPA